MGLRLFISYARADKLAHISRLVTILHQAGFEPWYDHHISPGDDWKEELLQAIKLCPVFIYALTPNSIESEWCRWEFKEAVKLRKPIIPVLLESIEKDKWLSELERLDYADFSQEISLDEAIRLIRGLYTLAINMKGTIPIPTAPENPQGFPASLTIKSNRINRDQIENVDLIRVLKGHTDGVRSVTFHKDSELLASASWDTSVRLWDGPRYSDSNRSLKNDVGPVMSVAFSPDGTLLASATRTRAVRLWNYYTQIHHPITLNGHQSCVNSVAFSPDGQFLASASGSSLAELNKDCSIRIWDLSNLDTPTSIYRHVQPINAVAFAPNSPGLLAFASDDMCVRILEIRQRPKVISVFMGHKQPIESIAFSPDGLYLASASKDGTIRIWPMPDGNNPIILKGHQNAVSSIAFSPDGSLLASGSRDGLVKIWEIPRARELRILTGHKDGVSCVTFSPDGALIASASWDKTIRVWGIIKSVQASTKPIIKRLPPTGKLGQQS